MVATGITSTGRTSEDNTHEENILFDFHNIVINHTYIFLNTVYISNDCCQNEYIIQYCIHQHFYHSICHELNISGSHSIPHECPYIHTIVSVYPHNNVVNSKRKPPTITSPQNMQERTCTNIDEGMVELDTQGNKIMGATLQP